MQFISVQTKIRVQIILISLRSSDTAKQFETHTKFLDNYFMRIIRIK